MIEGQIKETEELKYESVIPVSAPDTKFQTFNTETGTWDIHADFKLIESIEELKEYAKTCKGIKVAVDTETTGLTYKEDFIVGFSVSKSAYDGIYVPIRHQIRTVTKQKEVRLDENGNPWRNLAGIYGTLDKIDFANKIIEAYNVNEHGSFVEDKDGVQSIVIKINEKRQISELYSKDKKGNIIVSEDDGAIQL